MDQIYEHVGYVVEYDWYGKGETYLTKDRVAAEQFAVRYRGQIFPVFYTKQAQSPASNGDGVRQEGQTVSSRTE